MRIVAARLTPLRLPLRAPLETGHGPVRERRGVLLELVADTGERGFGEALPLVGFGAETPERVGSVLEALSRTALGRDPRELGEVLDTAERDVPDAPFARSALDVALHDLAARTAGRSVAAWLAGSAEPKRSVAVGALLGHRDPQGCAEQARRAATQGFTTLKLKIGSEGPERDAARVAAVRRALGPGPRLRLDANAAWSETQAREAAQRLAPFDIEYLEQPVAAGAIEALARLRTSSPIPIAVDESACDESSALRVLERRAADWIVVKPAALGGLRAAQRLAQRARAAHMGVVVSSALDSAIGRTAALHLAAALPAPHAAAGLATGGLLGADLATAPEPRAGLLSVPEVPGLGVAPDADAVRWWAVGETAELRA